MGHHYLIIYIHFVALDMNPHTKFQVTKTIGTPQSTSNKNLNLSLIASHTFGRTD